MTDEERIISCQQEIRRLRGVVRECEEKSAKVSKISISSKVSFLASYLSIFTSSFYYEISTCQNKTQKASLFKTF